jgi:hypothetical protein
VPHLADEPLESGDVRGGTPDQLVHPLPVAAPGAPLEDRAQRDHGRQRDQRRVERVDPGGVPVAEDLPGPGLQRRNGSRVEDHHPPAAPRHHAGVDQLVLDRLQRGLALVQQRPPAASVAVPHPLERLVEHLVARARGARGHEDGRARVLQLAAGEQLGERRPLDHVVQPRLAGQLLRREVVRQQVRPGRQCPVAVHLSSRQRVQPLPRRYGGVRSASRHGCQDPHVTDVTLR